MYMCVIVIDFISFYDFSNGVWNCSDGVVLFVIYTTKTTTSKQANKKRKEKKQLWQNGKGEVLQIHTS